MARPRAGMGESASTMKITFDEQKRLLTLEKRGLDFKRAEEIFDGVEATIEDNRQNYGETRFNTFGFLDERLVVLTWTLRGEGRRIISLRKANEREKQRFGRSVGRS
jgi:hypothetical protein